MNAADFDDQDDANALLSAPGATRRREILADVLRAADGRRRKRLAVRSGAGVACVLVALFAVPITTPTREEKTVVVQPPPPPTTRTRPTIAMPRPLIVIRPAPATTPIVRVEVIRGDLADRRWEVLNDDQFLDALADAGRPSGLARINGVTTVVPQ